MRIDKLLWFLRLAASRKFAHGWVLAGHIRLNGVRVERASTLVKPGDVLTLPMRTRIIVIELIACPARRGPASEAQACYIRLDAPPASPLARDAPDAPLA